MHHEPEGLWIPEFGCSRCLFDHFGLEESTFQFHLKRIVLNRHLSPNICEYSEQI